jgi:hypothetical protein
VTEVILETAVCWEIAEPHSVSHAVEKVYFFQFISKCGRDKSFKQLRSTGLSRTDLNIQITGNVYQKINLNIEQVALV